MKSNISWSHIFYNPIRSLSEKNNSLTSHFKLCFVGSPGSRNCSFMAGTDSPRRSCFGLPFWSVLFCGRPTSNMFLQATIKHWCGCRVGPCTQWHPLQILLAHRSLLFSRIVQDGVAFPAVMQKVSEWEVANEGRRKKLAEDLLATLIAQAAPLKMQEAKGGTFIVHKFDLPGGQPYVDTFFGSVEPKDLTAAESLLDFAKSFGYTYKSYWTPPSGSWQYTRFSPVWADAVHLGMTLYRTAASNCFAPLDIPRFFAGCPDVPNRACS